MTECKFFGKFADFLGRSANIFASSRQTIWRLWKKIWHVWAIFFAIRRQKFRAPGASAWASPPALSQNRLHRCGGFLHKLRVKVVSLLEQIIMSVHGTKAHPSCIFIRCVGWFAEYVLWWSLKTNWIYLNLRMIIVTCYLLSAQQKCPDTKSTQVYNKMLTHASKKQPALYFWELSICSARCSILSWLAVNLVNWRKWKKNFVKFYSDAWFPFLQGGGKLWVKLCPQCLQVEDLNPQIILPHSKVRGPMLPWPLRWIE